MIALALGLGLSGCAHRVPVGSLTPALAPCCVGIADGRLRQVLEAGSASTDVATRQIALAALVRAEPGPAAGAWGRRARFDPDEFVQQRVAIALGERVGDPAARDLLREMALSPSLAGVTRGRAAAAALRLDPDVVWLAPVWHEADGWESAALLAVGARTDPALADRLGRVLATGEVPFEVGFWDLVAACGRPAVGVALLEALPRLDPDLEVTAVVALLGLDPGAAQARLTGLLHGDVDHALEVVERVQTLAVPAATEVLRLASVTAPGPAARAARLWLLLREDAPERVLLEGIADPDPEVRRIAFVVAGGLAARGRDLPVRVRSGLIAGLEAEDPGLQIAAVDAVAAGPDAGRLRPLLEDESLELRVRVAAALSRPAR